MKIFFDTEFNEDGKNLELISIGLVREDGAEYYAEDASFDWNKPHDPWLDANVKIHMRGGDYLKQRSEIARDIVTFAGMYPTFYAWYCNYDWVALCRLYGRMLDLPKGWPMYCRDLKVYMDMLGITVKPEQATGEHDALADARWNKQMYQFLLHRASNIAQTSYYIDTDRIQLRL